MCSIHVAHITGSSLAISLHVSVLLAHFLFFFLLLRVFFTFCYEIFPMYRKVERIIKQARAYLVLGVKQHC